MNYLSLFKEKFIESNEQYPQNDIGIARLFYDLHSGSIESITDKGIELLKKCCPDLFIVS